MGILKGKTNVTILELEQNQHEDLQSLLEAAKSYLAMPLKDAEIAEDTCGFAPGKILLGQEITEENSAVGKIAVLNIRRTARKLDSGLVKAEIQRAEAEYMKQNRTDYVPRERQKQIKDDILDMLRHKRTLAVKGMEFAILADERTIIADTASIKETDSLLMHLACDLGIIGSRIKRSPLNCRKFFTWLYCQAQKGSDITERIGAFIEGPLELIANDFNSDEQERLTKAKIEGSLVTESDELAEMLNRNKLLRKAKVSIVIDDIEWHESDKSKEKFAESNDRFKKNGYKAAKAQFGWYNPRRYIVMNQARRFGNYCQYLGWDGWVSPCQCAVCRKKKGKQDV